MKNFIIVLLFTLISNFSNSSVAGQVDKFNDPLNVHVIGNKLYFHGKVFECAIGRNGISENKKEGDGTTPAGEYVLLDVWYRADEDRNPEPIETNLPLHQITPEDGWCDQSGDRKYNQHVLVNYPESKENLWRDDHVYDIFAVINYNINPTKEGVGSAIFFHIVDIKDGKFSPTAGCVALKKADLKFVLQHYTPDTKFIIN